MKTTLWLQIVKTYKDGEEEVTTVENLGHEADSWEAAFIEASADYFNKGWTLTSDASVLWFKISIVNKLMAVEHNMTAEWTRPVVEEKKDETPVEPEEA